MLRDGASVHLTEGAGFAILAAQRDAELAADWPNELQALYVLRAYQGRGLGRALLRTAPDRTRRPFSAFVLEGNEPALKFYLRTGTVELFRRPDRVGGHPVVDIALGWPDPNTV